MVVRPILEGACAGCAPLWIRACYHLSLFFLKKSETLLIFNWVRSDSYGEFSSGYMWYTHLTMALSMALSLRNSFLRVVAALLALVVWIWFKRSLNPTLFLWTNHEQLLQWIKYHLYTFHVLYIIHISIFS